MSRLNKALPAIALSAITLFQSPAYAAETPVVYSLENIKSQILSQNLEYKRAQQDVEIAQYTLDKAEDDEGLVTSTALETAKHDQYYTDSAEAELAYAQWNLKEKSESLELSAKEYYYSLLLKNTELALQQQKITRMNGQLADIKTKISLGLATQSAATTMQISIDKETLALQSLKNDKANLMHQLNLLMGQDLTLEFLPKSSDIPVGSYSDDLDAAITKALAGNGELAYLDAEGDLLAELVEIYTDLNDDDGYNRTIVSYKTQVNQKRFDYKDKETSLSFDARLQYLNLLSLKADCDVQQYAIDNQAINLKIETERYKVGMVTENSLKELEETLAFAKLELDKKKLETYLAAQELKNALE